MDIDLNLKYARHFIQQRIRLLDADFDWSEILDLHEALFYIDRAESESKHIQINKKKDGDK